MSDFAFLNGSFLPAASACLSPTDAGFVYGATITDRVRTYGGKLFAVDEHVARFLDGLRQIGVELPEADHLGAVVEELAERNGASKASDLACILVGTPGPPNERPTLLLQTALQPRPEWSVGYRQGWQVFVSKVRALSEDSLPRDIKHRNRLHWYQAGRAVPDADRPVEPLLLDADGVVTETAYGNLIVYKGGILSAVERGRCLPGVTEAAVLKLAADSGTSVEFAAMDLTDLRAADEIMLTSTGYTVAPVTRIDDNAVGDGRPGPMWRKLADLFSESVSYRFTDI